MRSHFELALIFVGTLDSSDIPVVCRHFVGCAQRKGNFQVGFASVPINRIDELDAIAGIACSQANGLHKTRPFSFASDLNRYSRWALLYDFYLCWATDKTFRRSLYIFEVHVPRRPLTGLVRRNRQPD